MNAPPPKAEPRVAHYLFAHRAVPRAFLQSPPEIMGILGSEDGMEFLSGMWDVLVGELEPHEQLPKDGLALTVYPLEGDAFVALVTLPPPQRVFEAYFVACAAKLGDGGFARAFTLDLAGPVTPKPDTGILEWDTEGKHTFIDEGPAPDASAFVDRVEAIINATDE